MSPLTRHGAPIAAVFDLLGTNENDLTAALGFTLARSSTLLDTLARRVWPMLEHDQLAAAAGPEVRGDIGRTDSQIVLLGALLIVDAKRDWRFRTTRQLADYAPRGPRPWPGVRWSRCRKPVPLVTRLTTR